MERIVLLKTKGIYNMGSNVLSQTKGIYNMGRIVLSQTKEYTTWEVLFYHKRK